MEGVLHVVTSLQKQSERQQVDGMRLIELDESNLQQMAELYKK